MAGLQKIVSKTHLLPNWARDVKMQASLNLPVRGNEASMTLMGVRAFENGNLM